MEFPPSKDATGLQGALTVGGRAAAVAAGRAEDTELNLLFEQPQAPVGVC